jgi:hypothetical protein
MPPLIVYEGADGVLVVYNRVTRATRIAKLAPGTQLLAVLHHHRAELVGRQPEAPSQAPQQNGHATDGSS